MERGGALRRGSAMVLTDDSCENRAAHYRTSAEESERLAAKAKTEHMKQAYLKLATEWRKLADDLEGVAGANTGKGKEE